MDLQNTMKQLLRAKFIPAFGSILLGIVMIIVNTIYFNKRKHIFVN